MKKTVYYLAIGLIGLVLTACGNKQENNVSQKQEKKVTQEPKQVKNDSLKTEYHIEDYENDYLIVSKSDGLLYGVIDRNNKVIIPVEQDAVAFCESSLMKCKGMAFFEVEYENEKSVFNQNGEKIIENIEESATINGVEYETTSTDDSMVVLCSKKSLEPKYEFYNEDGTRKSQIEIPEYEGESVLAIKEEWINETCFIVYVMTSKTFDTYLYSYDGNLLKKWKDCQFRHSNDRGKSGDEYHVYIEGGNWEKGDITAEKIGIDKDGNIKTIEKISDRLAEYASDEEPVSINKTYKVGLNNENRIYKSNDTWKYQDSSGNAIYDDRYYSCEKINSAYLLSNEDKKACVITEDGKKTIDYGEISWDGDEDYIYQSIRLDKHNFFSDYDSVCIVTKESEGEVAHFFE